MPSNEDQGWLNYCSDESVTPCTPRAGACDEHRDPDGNGEFLVCGDESAALHLPEKESGLTEVAIADPRGFDELEELKTLEPLMAPHRTIGQADPGVPSRFVFEHLDHLGSPRVILDINGELVMKHHYLPFGEERPTAVNSSNPTINTKGFTGHERDQENGLDYMMARYYSSSLGRFMAVDPGDDTQIEDPQSWNRFVYVRNNPLMLVDRTGEGAQIPAAAGRWQEQEARKTPEQRAADRKATAGRASNVGKGLMVAKYAAYVGAVVAAGIGAEPVAAGLIATGRALGAGEVVMDGVAVANDPSPENIGAIAGDLAGAGLGAGVGALGNAAAGPAPINTMIKSVGALIQEDVSDLGGAFVSVTAGSALAGSRQSPCSGGGDTSVDRAIADKEARAAKGPAPKPKTGS
jgi:RHS repeat-associated protein